MALGIKQPEEDQTFKSKLLFTAAHARQKTEEAIVAIEAKRKSDTIIWFNNKIVCGIETAISEGKTSLYAVSREDFDFIWVKDALKNAGYNVDVSVSRVTDHKPDQAYNHLSRPNVLTEHVFKISWA